MGTVQSILKVTEFSGTVNLAILAFFFLLNLVSAKLVKCVAMISIYVKLKTCLSVRLSVTPITRLELLTSTH